MVWPIGQMDIKDKSMIMVWRNDHGGRKIVVDNR